MVNDLNVDFVDLWEYVDDATIAEVISKNDQSTIQEYGIELARKTRADRSCDEFEAIVVIDKNIEVVPSAKLLGLIKSNELKRQTTF